MRWASVQRAVAARRRPVAALLAGLAVLSALTALRPPGPPTVAVLVAARDLAAGTALTLDDLRPVPLPESAVPAGVLRPGAAVLGRLVAGPVRAGEPLTDVRLVGPGLLAALAPGYVAVPVRFADPGAVALLRAGDRVDVLAAPADAYAAPPGYPDALAAPGAAGPGADPSAGGPGAAADPSAAGPGTAAGTGSRPARGGTPRPPTAGAGAGSGAAQPGTVAGEQGQDTPRVHPRDASRPGAPLPGARVVAADVVVLAVPVTDDTSYGDGALVVVACSPAVARALAAAGAYERLSPALRGPAEGAPP